MEMARVGVWCVVCAWWCAPILWLLLTAIYAEFHHLMQFGQWQPGGVAEPIEAPRGNFSVAMLLLGGSSLAVAFAYGMWCAVGIILGFGAERAIATAELVWGERPAHSTPTPSDTN